MLPSSDQIRDTLLKRVAEANARAAAAAKVFTAVIREVPGGSTEGYSTSDGVQRMHNVSQDLDQARSQVLKAHKDLNEFTLRGIIPDDLKPRT